MEFFDQIVVPPSANHILLLKYIFIVSLLLFLPYLGMMMGASFLSVYFNGKGARTGNSIYTRFAKDVIAKLAITKNAELALGIVPALSIIFIYAQLLYQAKTITVSVMALSVVLFIAAFILINKYRSGFKIESVISSLKKSGGNQEGSDEVSEYEDTLNRNIGLSGKIGTTLLYLAAYFFVGCTMLAANPERWVKVNNILQVFFSGATLFNFLYLLALAGVISGAGILFYFFKWPALSMGKQGGMSDEYAGFVKHFASTLAFVSSLFLPVLMFFSFLFLTGSALSFEVFVLLILALITALVLSNVLYMMYKNSETGNESVKFSAIVFFLVIIFFAFNILKEESVLGNALTQQTYTIITKADEHEKEVKSKLVTTSGISGEEIYNTKCIACHKFDVKVVGPPYQETVPKYNGDAQKLAEFIFNPTPKNPGYPPMPNQGLKKKEATAVAQFLIQKVSGKK
jgi:cytochrome c